MTIPAPQPDAQPLRRSLSSGQLSMIAIGGAIGTGLLLGSGFAISSARPSVLLSYAIGGLIALAPMGCLAEMTVAHPSTGSFAWIEHGFSLMTVAANTGFLLRSGKASCTCRAAPASVLPTPSFGPACF